MKYFALITVFCLSLSLGACGGDSAAGTLAEPEIQPPSKLPKKLVIRDIEEGAGPAAKKGDKLTVEYFAVDEKGKARFSTWDDSGPSVLVYKLGDRYYFPAWDEGLTGMKAGGRRELIIPAGETGVLGYPLIYVIDVVQIK